jgi:hypothetical protein
MRRRSRRRAWQKKRNSIERPTLTILLGRLCPRARARAQALPRLQDWTLLTWQLTSARQLGLEQQVCTHTQCKHMLYTHTRTRSIACTRAHVHTHAHTHTHTRASAHTHAHTHTHARARVIGKAKFTPKRNLRSQRMLTTGLLRNWSVDGRDVEVNDEAFAAPKAKQSMRWTPNWDSTSRSWSPTCANARRWATCRKA